MISNPDFICRFLRPQVATLINYKGLDLCGRKWMLTVFKNLMSFHGLKEEPTVVGTYNDLVLCCATREFERVYYICNPHTSQWIALPPTPTQSPYRAKAGIICDPYYNYKEDGAGKGQIFQLNSEYRCKVVRLLPLDFQFKQKDQDFGSFKYKFKVQVFSCETGEWTESVVLSEMPLFEVDTGISLSCKGVLYWMGYFRTCFLGLDPFMIINTNSNGTSCNSVDYSKCQLIKIGSRNKVECVGICRGCLRMCSFDWDTSTLDVWDMKRDEFHSQMVAGNWEHKVYELREDLAPMNDLVPAVIASDPNNDDLWYLNIDGEIVRCNIRTGKWSEMVGKSELNLNGHLFPLVLPWWPNPVPRLPQHSHGGGISS